MAATKLILDYVFEHEAARANTVFLTQPIGGGKTVDYTWGQMIEHMGMEEWIRATDFIGSGTVGTGCGLEQDLWIKSGDIIELEIEQIGKLINKVGKKVKK